LEPNSEVIFLKRSQKLGLILFTFDFNSKVGLKRFQLFIQTAVQNLQNHLLFISLQQSKTAAQGPRSPPSFVLIIAAIPGPILSLQPTSKFILFG
jgi:hypothetical protein